MRQPQAYSIILRKIGHIRHNHHSIPLMAILFYSQSLFLWMKAILTFIMRMITAMDPQLPE